MAGEIETGNQRGLIYDISEVVVGLAENKKATFIRGSLFYFKKIHIIWHLIIPLPRYYEN